MEDLGKLYRNSYYDQNHVLSKCEDIVLEAKRVLLNEDIEKMANFSLSIVEKQQDQKFSRTEDTVNSTRHCKKRIEWNDDSWENLPHPRNINDGIGVILPVPNNFQEENQIVKIVIEEILHTNSYQIYGLPKQNNGMELCQKYFYLWRHTVKMIKLQKESLDAKLQEKKKLDNFLKRIKMCKKLKKQKYLTMKGAKSKDSNGSINQLSNSLKSSDNYKYRFTAQKNIIDKQKAKLDEQTQIIEELKFGIIREDLMKSIEHTKVNIREIFANCSESVKCKVPITLADEKIDFKINTNKAPRIIQKMEQRAMERAQNRQIIQERKRLIEEHKQRLLEEIIEKKKALEEDERKKCLEIMREKRKKELEMEKIRQANKQRYLDNLDTAIKFHNRCILRKCFKNLYDNMQLSRLKHSLACQHYQNKTLHSCLTTWLNYMDDLYKIKNELAKAHFEYGALKRCIKTWKAVHLENVRNLQVAEDIYDFRLTNNTFINWHRYVCIQIMLQDKNMKVAAQHYKRKILFQYFYQWRSLKVVIELEKAKEMKKQKWREKVWEILPDYKPPEDI